MSVLKTTADFSTNELIIASVNVMSRRIEKIEQRLGKIEIDYSIEKTWMKFNESIKELESHIKRLKQRGEKTCKK